MSYRVALGRLAAVVLSAVALSACGSSPATPLSSDAVADKARGISGEGGQLYTHQPQLVRDGHSADNRKLLIIVACKRSGACILIGRDGATYPDMQAFVDRSPDVRSGDHVFANADPTHPAKKAQLAEFVRSDGLPWGWYAGGGTLLLVLLAGIGWLVVRKSRRSAN